jgi:hypothetical protein
VWRILEDLGSKDPDNKDTEDLFIRIPDPEDPEDLSAKDP